ncbi:FHA domain-containing protein [Pseudonocardia sp. RS11V-5]|uniref:FtsK/SpoIIIE domain-containing protein n=1 Tax=Pseudonocardia terrae TaxID=2905831 RepID=UPI001E5BCD95|nr:FtsK/SpoIIIE domain-containing protein [Pseudonocardia terrae]MCE3552386.1 FHA domain-containing protein [Pseudonocardia terrae]
MHYRLTVSDGATGIRSDVVVECEPTDPVGVVLDLVAGVLPVRGAPTVSGAFLDPSAAVAVSALREGAVLAYGPPAAGAPDPFGTAPGREARLRVVAGPSAGLMVPVVGHLEIGRAPTAGLVLDDPDVSRVHARVQGGPAGVQVSDAGSANGVFVDGRRVEGAHALREGEVLQLGGTRLVLEDPARARAALSRTADGAYLLNRAFPDRRAPFTAPTVTLPTPLPEDDARGIPLLAMGIPLVLAVVLALVLKSPIYLLFGLLSPVMLGANWWTERRRRKAREQRAEGSYTEKLRAARVQVEAAVDDEDADLRRAYPDPTTVVRMATELRRELWSRRSGDDDWLRLRVGTADRRAAVVVQGERPADWADAMLRAAPVGIDLEAAGVLGLAGAQSHEHLGWVLTQIATGHSADELAVAVLAPDTAEDELGWVRWLPHARTASGGVLAAWDDESVALLVRELGEQLDRIEAERCGPLGAPGRAVAGQVVVVLVGAGRLVRSPQVADLLVRGPALGFRFVCTDRDERLLPDSCRAVVSDRGGQTVVRIDRGDELVVRPDRLAPGTEERVARILAPLRRVGDSPLGGLPAAVRFTEVVDVGDPDAIRAAWRLVPERTDIILGRSGDGLFTLDIAADGPHAVVAGTSGAGKSELLQTWVGALALANSPERLSVVFMDYKGGAAFRDLVALPHVVGTVTNLDERLARRALASLRAELTRRQHQLKLADAQDRNDYLRRAERDPGLPAFPRLLIVVDELAELKDQLPELVEGLVGVARIGRSLGVHLVLATQRPAGVVDSQIRANVNLRVCLRTRDEGESIDVIETGDAARIPVDRPGRALVGSGGPVATLVQTARITTPVPDGSGAARRAVSLAWSAPAAPVAAATGGLRTDLHELVERVASAAEGEGLVAPFRPWSAPLADLVLLESLEVTPGHLLLGLVDRPAQQRQDVLSVPLGTGHLGVVGSSRTGRTATLRSIAAGLAMSDPADTVHVHAVDGGRGLAALAALPNVGVVADDDDPERTERLLVRLTDEVRRRRRLLAEHGAASVAELTDPPPAIVLLVDDWHGVVDGDGPAQAALQELLGSGSAAAGVTVCLAGDERLLRGRLLTRLDHRLCLRLNNPADATALGLGPRNLPDGLPAGRALWADDGCEVQIPLLGAERSGPAQVQALRTIAATARARHGEPAVERAPMRLDALPLRIGPAAAEPLPTARSGHVLAGVSGDRLSRIELPLAPGAPVLVAGPPRSGRSTAIVQLATDAARRGLDVALVAGRPSEIHEQAIRAGVRVVAPPDVAGADLVAVDDAELLTVDDEFVAALSARPGLIVGATLDAFGFGARGLVQAARRRPGGVVLLCPPNNLAAENVGVKIERGSGFTGPPGRALFALGGELILGHVIDPAAD